MTTYWKSTWGHFQLWTSNIILKTNSLEPIENIDDQDLVGETQILNGINNDDTPQRKEKQEDVNSEGKTNDEIA